ncbi:MAG: hypothetical protein MI922_24530, partial [Bacteroidales bacterium]|nr:hypothetical protein [Bacteroidales bacterium]
MKNKILLFILTAFLPVVLLAQTHKIDSLQEVVNTSLKKDTNRVLALYKLAGSVYARDPERMKVLTDEAFELSQDLEYKLGLMKCKLLYGDYYRFKKQYTTAEKKFREAIDYAQSNAFYKDIAPAYSNIGKI